MLLVTNEMSLIQLSMLSTYLRPVTIYVFGIRYIPNTPACFLTSSSYSWSHNVRYM